MSATTDTTTTDLVLVDDVNDLDNSDDKGTPSVALVGAAALAAGVAIGTYVVPTVVGYVKGLFAKSPADPVVVEQVEQIMTNDKNKGKSA